MAGSHKPLDQQVIVITGASSGIGLATADLAASNGAKVVLIARSGDTLDEVAREIREAGGQAIHVVADVSDRGEIERAARVAIDRFGRIDTWVNNAGVSIYGKLREVSEENSRRLFDINFWGVVNGSLAALPWLAQSRGTLVNVGSEVSEAVIPLQGMYAASKHAVKGFTDSLRVECEYVDRMPVTISLIEPTAVNTPFPQHARNYMDREPKLPSPQLDPLDVAKAILRAATRSTRYIKVGTVSKLDTIMESLMPSVAERMASLHVMTQRKKQPSQHFEGTLYRAGETGRMHGMR